MIRSSLTIILLSALSTLLFGNTLDGNNLRIEAERLYQEGHYKEALAKFEILVSSTDTDPRLVVNDFNKGIYCLANLGQWPEKDDWRENALKIHGQNWRLVQAAALSLRDDNHWGYLIAGEYQRGDHRGGGKYVNSMENDRVKALDMFEQARHLLNKSGVDATDHEKSYFFTTYADTLTYYRGQTTFWRMQILTDLKNPPDYEEGYGYYTHQTGGAPTDSAGNPIYYQVPENFESARNDGMRYRWLLEAARKTHPARGGELDYKFASFLHQHFGVHTMAHYAHWFQAFEPNDDKETRDQRFALHKLPENETVAKLAGGIKRFLLPEEYNFIRLFKHSGKQGYSSAYQQLAQIFENRRQYNKAVQYWSKVNSSWSKDKIRQIQNPWGMFEAHQDLPAGDEASLEFRFRNGNKVTFQAFAIKEQELLQDVQEYLKGNPWQLNWNKINLNQIGYRLVHENEKRYIGEEVAEWTLDLSPRKNHFDKRMTVQTPIRNAGAYLLVARMKDGNESRIILWLKDTLIARKTLNKQSLYWVTDAITGKPLPDVPVHFFGYYQEYVNNKVLQKIGRSHITHTTAFTRKTDAQGRILLSQKELSNRYQWLVTVNIPGSRLAFLGFQGIWHTNYTDHAFSQTKTYTITDRPVYRPGDKVQFKTWLRNMRYDLEDVSTYANRNLNFEILDPMGEKVLQKSYLSDAFGGFAGTLELPENARLGVYACRIPGYPQGVTFRVEEYKKPEFEVTLKAPDKPVALGEVIDVTINARYYFGLPVTQAKVKIKVHRNTTQANWYPAGEWDWFYGRGYWWFTPDTPWYPGWHKWGCFAPYPWWMGEQPTPPEVVLEKEMEMNEMGEITLSIDTEFAKTVHGDKNHKYTVTAEVTDQSRRTIVGQGEILVASVPYKVYSWLDRGFYRTNDVIKASFSAQTLDNRPVSGLGLLTLYKVTYDDSNTPKEKMVQTWNLELDAQGKAQIQCKASSKGQYRFALQVSDPDNHTQEGGVLFTVMGEGMDGNRFQFNDIELIQNQREYAPGDKVQLLINTHKANSVVALFLRPANGVYLEPEIFTMTGKSRVVEIPVSLKDMPNFFVEAMTIHSGRVYTATREIIVPPEKRILEMEVLPEKDTFKPGEEANLKIKVRDQNGNPFHGSLAVSIYDKALEYISGGSNVSDIRPFFWKWRRTHNPYTEHNLEKWFYRLLKKNQIDMQSLGVFGDSVADDSLDREDRDGGSAGGEKRRQMKAKKSDAPRSAVAMDAVGRMEMKESLALAESEESLAQHVASPEAATVTPVVRKQFADTAYWNGNLSTNADGIVKVTLNMPENLSTWKIRSWGMGHGTRVGEGTAEMITTKNLLLRLQAPRFFIEKDEGVLSANIHNELDEEKKVTARLVLPGGYLENTGSDDQVVVIPAGGQARVDWRVKVLKEGEAVIQMQALTDEESDAVEMNFPVYVHGIDKRISVSGHIPNDKTSATFTLDIPEDRRKDSTRLEIRYSPTLAGAMVDALPYLVDYPYGCTEQTLNRFLPTVITQSILQNLNLDLQDIQEKRTNLNAQEIGDDRTRAQQWKHWKRNPVFDVEEVQDMVRIGVLRLTSMQLSDGGWGWFTGWGEHSSPHTTAVVVHGLQIAKEYGADVDTSVIQRGENWLKQYQARELQKLKNAPTEKKPWKHHPDDMDALIYLILTDADKPNKEMREYLYKDRLHLSVYGLSSLGMGLFQENLTEPLNTVIRNIEQYLVQDPENQTAYLELPNSGYWWYWYGSEYETHAYYLKLLSKTGRLQDGKASGLVKYLLNNRKNATYWNSTRDTALVIEAFADYLKASKELACNLQLEIKVDGSLMKQVKMDTRNLFTFDNTLLMTGEALKSGKHTIEITKKGQGPIYFNAYLDYFSLEDPIAAAGLEIKVNRKFYRLEEVEASTHVAGHHGQVVNQRVEKWNRHPLQNGEALKSGDRVLVELLVESKNDYEYIILEDWKAAGLEPIEIRSGYNGNEMGAYIEYRDEKVALFVQRLARGRHSVSYELRAEIPGKFSALPTLAEAMYAPELKANGDEFKIQVID